MDTEGFVAENQKPYGKIVLGKKIELFDLENDEGEENDISKLNPDKAKVLVDKLKNWWLETNAQLPEDNENYDPTNPFFEISNKLR